MLKISVIVPVYNVEKYLRECLDSIIKQTLEDIEIICINDGSTDSSLAILEEYAQKDSRIQIINKENAGYGHSMNIGFEKAAGEYIGIVESDDFIEPCMFEELCKIADNNNCDIVKSDWYNFWTKDGSKIKNGRVCDFNEQVTNISEHPEMLCIQPSIWSAVYKTEFVKNTKVRFLETPGASYQDTSVSFKLFSLAKRIVFTNKAYLYYRQDNVNSSINNSGKAMVICKEFEEIDRFLNVNGDIKKIVNSQKLISQYKGYRWTLKRITPELRKDFVKEISKEFQKYSQNNEILQDVYERIGYKKLNRLINNPKLFLRKFEYNMKINKWRDFRRKFISIRLNSSRFCLTVFGRKIVSLG